MAQQKVKIKILADTMGLVGDEKIHLEQGKSYSVRAPEAVELIRSGKAQPDGDAAAEKVREVGSVSGKGGKK